MFGSIFRCFWMKVGETRKTSKRCAGPTSYHQFGIGTQPDGRYPIGLSPYCSCEETDVDRSLLIQTTPLRTQHIGPEDYISASGQGTQVIVDVQDRVFAGGATGCGVNGQLLFGQLRRLPSKVFVN